jgi:hypothetical protein
LPLADCRRFFIPVTHKRKNDNEPERAMETKAEPSFSRTGVQGPYGSLEGELKTKVDLDLEMEFRRKCAEAGTDHSSVLRNWVNEFIRGVSYDKAVADAMERRAQLLPRRGPNGAPLELRVVDPMRDRGVA